MSKNRVQSKESERIFKEISRFFNKLNQNTVLEDKSPQKRLRADDALSCTTDCEEAMKKIKHDFFGSSEEYSIESPKVDRLVPTRQSTEDFPMLCERFTSDDIDYLLAPTIFDSPTVEEPREKTRV